MFFEFPTKNEWRELEKSYPFKKLQTSEEHFLYTSCPNDGIERGFAISEISIWRLHLENRLIQTRWSYVLLMFHFNKGIPDDEWFISPGRKGESIQYFPHFEKKDRLVKAQFNYYVDVFYYKLFSAWDTLGHLLNAMYGLEIRKASFDKAIKKLKTVKPTLYDKLKEIVDSPDFEKMRNIRHSATHNHLPGHVGSIVERISTDKIKGFAGIVGSYTPSAQIKDNVTKSLDLFAATLKVIKEQSLIDNPS